MTRDYAKKRGHSSPYSSSRSKSTIASLLPGWVWLFLGVVLGLSTAGFAFYQWGDKLETKPTTPPAIIHETKGGPQAIDLAKEDSKPRFDFYTLLPNLKVDLPDVATPESARKQPDEKQDNQLAYIIQTGAFKTQDQADQQKANLALEGFESQVQTVNIRPDETWYRVYIGPYPNKDEAMATQQNMDEHQAAHSLILKIRV